MVGNGINSAQGALLQDAARCETCKLFIFCDKKTCPRCKDCQVLAEHGCNGVCVKEIMAAKDLSGIEKILASVSSG